MRRLLFIGGGEISQKETLPIDLEFLRLSGGKKAVVGFFPTAASDSDEYIEEFGNYYRKLGCKEVISVKLSELSEGGVKSLVRRVTGIYLGGGNTKTLVETFKKAKVDVLINKLMDKGVVVAGMSAGALAMCDFYIDSGKGKSGEVQKGWGWQDSLLVTVHYQKKRDDEILRKLEKVSSGRTVVGIKEKQAILLEDEQMRWIE